MLPPTVTTLTELAQYATTADVLAAAADRDIGRYCPRSSISGEQIESPAPASGGLRVVTRHRHLIRRTACARSRASASVLLAPNPSPMTLEGTNTWMLRGSGAPESDGYIVIDAGPAG